jgi:hypothetical protein
MLAAQPDDQGSIGWHELAGTALSKATEKGRPICPPEEESLHGVTGCSAVIRAWGSAVADTKRNRLILWGGGHNDYYGNELYALELGNTPARMVRLNEPTRPGNGIYGCKCSSPASGACNLADIPPPPATGYKAPNSRHTYNQIEYLPETDSMFAFGGFTAGCVGVAHDDAWVADLHALEADASAKIWTRIDGELKTSGLRPGKASGSPFGGNFAYDPGRKAVWYDDQVGLFLFDPNTKTVVEKGEIPVGPYGAMALNPESGVLLFASWDGQKQSNRLTIASTLLRGSIRGSDITEKMSTCKSMLSAGRLNSIGLVFDPVWKVFVAWPNFGSSIFLINPSAKPLPIAGAMSGMQDQFLPYSCTELTSDMLGHTQGPKDSAHTGEKHSSNGTFGRFRYFPEMDAYALCSDADTNCFLLRLRAKERHQ